MKQKLIALFSPRVRSIKTVQINTRRASAHKTGYISPNIDLHPRTRLLHTSNAYECVFFDGHQKVLVNAAQVQIFNITPRENFIRMKRRVGQKKTYQNKSAPVLYPYITFVHAQKELLYTRLFTFVHAFSKKKTFHISS